MWIRALSRAYRRLAIAWLALSIASLTAVGLYERARFGRNDAEGASRLKRLVERQLASAIGGLDEVVDRAAGRARELVASSADHAAARALFSHLEALRRLRPDISITVYSADAVPVAWSGRPADLPRSRVTGGRAVFVAPGPLGPRLVAVRPIPAGQRTGGTPALRSGALAAELRLPTMPSGTGAPPESVVWPAAGIDVPLRARYQGAGAEDVPGTFLLVAPDGTPLLEGRLDESAVTAARSRLRHQSVGLLLLIAALCATLSAAPPLAWRRRESSRASYLAASSLALAAIGVARWCAWEGWPRLAHVLPGSHWPPLFFRSGPDFLMTAAAILLVTLILADSVVTLRRACRSRRQAVDGTLARTASFALAAAASAAVATAVFAASQAVVHRLTATSAVDVFAFSVYSGNLARLATDAGLVLGAASAGWLAVTLLLAALVPFRVRMSGRIRAATVLLWSLPPVAWWIWSVRTGSGTPVAAGVLVPAALAIAVASGWRPLARRYRHASQGARLLLLFAGFVAPVVSWYPGLVVESDRAKRHLVATQLAPQATRQRDDLQERVRRAQSQIDAIPDLPALARAGRPATPGPVPADAAFHVWSRTDLSRYRVTSALELYAVEGLSSRFALKLPDYASTQQRWEGSGCSWEVFEEVSPFFSEERRLLYAGRGLCEDTPTGPRVVGAVAIYAMLDYADLPVLSTQPPYVALLRGDPALDPEDARRQDIDVAVYGWSRRPLYASRAAWTLDDATFSRIYASREPFWTTLDAGGRRYAVHFVNDRGGIYAFGYPALTLVGHAVNLAELAALGGVVFIVLALCSWLTAMAGGYVGLRGRDLLREIRASFYRKLFLAFVAAAVIPVVTLAVVARAYLSARLHADIEEAAARTTAVAQRVVEDYAQLQERGDHRITTLDDDILVWIARLINQDVNVFEGPDLVATSERNLYASGVLPTRTPADVYRAIVLDRRATSVVNEQIGRFGYLVASAPVRLGGREAILSVPLTLRQRAIEREIDDLNRRVLLAIVAFILAASGLGYWMAERIADPVSRLQRATARISRGDLTARVALTSSDELRRLVEAFNAMALALQRQQGQLERTHRLEAWAEMARQVAHEIKNPLTPIQLSAEHLRRVHADRGTPLSPVLESCVDSILAQVRLLRQIAAEFSSFASSPAPRPVDTDLVSLVAEVVEPYVPGVGGRLTVQMELPEDLPALTIDRTLIGRALTNVVDNALHAMPGTGTLKITAHRTLGPDGVALVVSDTGMGMDATAVERIFEPYFSTKATGTGLGLTIARRNVEIHGGTISVVSAPGHGTSVTIWLPLTPPAAPAA